MGTGAPGVADLDLTCDVCCSGVRTGLACWCTDLTERGWAGCGIATVSIFCSWKCPRVCNPPAPVTAGGHFGKGAAIRDFVPLDEEQMICPSKRHDVLSRLNLQTFQTLEGLKVVVWDLPPYTY